MPNTPISRILRRWPAALLGIIAFFTAWNLWAVFVDRQLTQAADSFLFPALQVALMDMEGEGVGALFRWGAKGPVATLLGLLLSYLVGAAPLGARLLSVLAHAALMAVCFSLARRVSGKVSAGLWAAFLCGGAPLLFGWGRLEYPDMLLALLVVGAIRLTVRRRVESPRPAAALGVLFALGIMTKVAFVAFMVVPGLWLLVRHLRGRKPASLVSLGITLGAMSLLAGPWIAVNFKQIHQNIIASSSTMDLSFMEKTAEYLGLAGVAPLLGAAAAAWVTLWFGGLVRRQDLGLLGGFLALTMMLFMGLFDSWSRYIVPALPVAAVLAACGLVQVGVWLPRPARLAGGALLVAAHLSWFIWLNLNFVPAPNRPRDYSEGIVCPDRRNLDGYPLAARAILARTGDPALLVMDHPSTNGKLENMQLIPLVWAFNGIRLNFTDLRAIWERLSDGHGVGVLVVRGAEEGPLDETFISNWDQDRIEDVHMRGEIFRQRQAALRWFLKQRPRLLGTFPAPRDLVYEAYEVAPPRPPAKPGPRPR